MLRSVTLLSSYVLVLLLMAAAYSFVPPGPDQAVAALPVALVAEVR